MSQMTVNFVNPGAGADIGMGGRALASQASMAAASRQERARQFDQSQAQQASQFQQTMQMNARQMALQERMERNNQEMARIENAMVVKKQNLESTLDRLQSQLVNSTMSGDLDILDDAHSQLNDLSGQLDRSNQSLMKLTILKHYTDAAAFGEDDGKGGHTAPLIEKDFADAMQSHLLSESTAERNLMESLGLALSDPTLRAPAFSPSSLGGPSGAAEAGTTAAGMGPEVGGVVGRTAALVGKVRDPIAALAMGIAGVDARKGSDLDPMVKGVTPSAIADKLTLHIAPHLGLTPEEEAGFRTMMAHLERANAANSTKDEKTRTAELEGASKSAQDLVDAGVDREKLGLVLSGLTRAGAEGRLSFGERLSQADLAKQMEGKKTIPVSMSDGDRAHYGKIETMGSLGFALRGKDGKYLFRPSAAIEQVKDEKTGETVLRKRGASLADILPEATADFIEHGGFKDKDKYLNRIGNPELRDRVRSVLEAREKAFANQVRGQGLDPTNFDLRTALDETTATKQRLEGETRKVEKQTTVKWARNTLKAKREYDEKAKTAEDELFKDVRTRVDENLADFGD